MTFNNPIKAISNNMNCIVSIQTPQQKFKKKNMFFIEKPDRLVKKSPL